ncbi:uncharacterized protein LOC134257661 [Saccostrea cucullata]|uniref:uncharacterized protein LOC134257661 n=1 Tax=Saccostrea cuccullata TaxID=36930 RepID=UPI002ED68738
MSREITLFYTLGATCRTLIMPDAGLKIAAKSMGKNDHCCVVNCSNRRSNLPKGHAFHQIPAAPISRRNAWIRATGRKLGKKRGELTITENTKVCGLHFVSGRKSNDPTNVDYIPTQNLPIQISTASKRRTNNSERAQNYSTAVNKAISDKRKILQKSGKFSFPLDLKDVQNEIEISDDQNSENTSNVLVEFPVSPGTTPDHTYYKFWVTPTKFNLDSANFCTDTSSQAVCETGNTSVQTETVISSTSYSTVVQVDTFEGHTTNLTNIQFKHHQKLINELQEKVKLPAKENACLNKKLFCVENLMTCNENAQFYTGLPHLETFNALFTYFEPKASKMTYWQGNETTVRTHENKGPSRKLSLKNEFFAVLVRLKLGLLVENIANRFDISASLFSKIFNTWIRFLRLELEVLFPFPCREKVQSLRPDSFSKFENTRIILDCTEIPIQKPSALKAQRETWSSYKHRNTYKALVGITPDGTVSYVSTLYGGAASDKFIVQNSGIVDLIELGDNVMADRGFEIDAELIKRGASLNIPPFRNGNFQLSSEQVETTHRIAEVRIHIERAIQRIKTFHILDRTMPLSLHIVADDIFKTC